MTQFYATLKKLDINEDGDSTLTLEIPLSGLSQVLQAAAYTKQLLTVNIHLADKKEYELNNPYIQDLPVPKEL